MECLGDDQTERIVVPSLDQLSTSTNVAVRRILAQLYGDFCAVVSITCAEKLVSIHMYYQIIEHQLASWIKTVKLGASQPGRLMFDIWRSGEF